MKYNASVNIELGTDNDFQYIVTPNVERVYADIVSGINQGCHSFSIIGTYGTGKSAFLMALESGLCGKNNVLVKEKKVFFGHSSFDIINVVGDYRPLSLLIGDKLGLSPDDNVIDAIKNRCKSDEDKGRVLVLVIDEFGKVLEHAAKNDPEQELYFIQKLAELINDHRRKAILLTTLHQNFGSYAHQLSEAQKNEWQKVKGRLKEVVFSEPIEQLLFLAAEQIERTNQSIKSCHNFSKIYKIAQEGHFISESFSFETAQKLYPLDPIAAECLTLAIQKYGQNERTLFSFLTSQGKLSINSFEDKENLSYNLSLVYDYITYNFYSAISEVNIDSARWSAIKVSISRAESGVISSEMIDDALSIIKTIGLLNIFSPSGAVLEKDVLIKYAKYALGIEDPGAVISKLEALKVIRFATYKSQYILFEGTDVDIESELLKATSIVPTPAPTIEELKDYIYPRIVPAYAAYYKKGTPRYFEFCVLNEPEVRVPEGDTDGFCELIFPLEPQCENMVQEQSANNPNANLYAVFKNIDDITSHLHEIKKLQYVLDRKAIDDIVAKREITNIQEFEKAKLNAALNDYLFSGDGNVQWYFKGEPQKISSRKDFNKLLSSVCEDVYFGTPVIRNELFNKQKLSSAISLAKSNLLDAILENSDKKDLGFDELSFPPEKTIYFSLLKNTGIHRLDDDGLYILGEPYDKGVQDFWNECQAFVASTAERPRKVSELIKILSARPYKLKQGFIDFWVPIYLFIRQQDFALYGANGNFVMNITKEFFDLLWKHPGDFSIKAFNVEGIKLEFFKKYRSFLNKDENVAMGKDSFANTYKPFLRYYKGLNEYAKNTKKFNDPGTAKFRDVLANASDPEKAFFEDLPEALGYRGSSLTNNDEFIKDYLTRIRSAIQELNNCYPELIKRIEASVVEQMGLPTDFSEYKSLLNSRYSSVKKHLLTQKARTFLERVLAPSDTRDEFVEKISSVVLDKRLTDIKDKEEEIIVDNIIFLFHEIDRYVGLSSISDGNSEDRLFSFGISSSTGINESQKAYRLPKSQFSKAEQIEKHISDLLSDDDNLNVCVLLNILANKMGRE